MFCCVGVAGTDVARLQLLELLLGAEFVGLCGVSLRWKRARGKGGEHTMVWDVEVELEVGGCG